MNSLGAVIAGVHFDDITPQDAARELATAQADPPRYIAFANAHSIEALRAQRALAIYDGFDIVIPDGISIVLAGWINGVRVRNRWSGIDLLRILISNENARHFFFGSSETTNRLVVERARRVAPASAEVRGSAAGTYPWSSVENQRYVDAINDFRPDFLWVSLSAPKQERWLAENRKRLNAKAAAAVGYAFDVFAGTKPLAPAWVRKSGLEWAYRFIHHPKHTWQRLAASAPRFLIREFRRWV